MQMKIDNTQYDFPLLDDLTLKKAPCSPFVRFLQNLRASKSICDTATAGRNDVDESVPTYLRPVVLKCIHDFRLCSGVLLDLSPLTLSLFFLYHYQPVSLFVMDSPTDGTVKKRRKGATRLSCAECRRYTLLMVHLV